MNDFDRRVHDFLVHGQSVAQRWPHATEIGASYGYLEFPEPLIALRMTRWL